jgi:hypothetical protein
MIVDSLKLKNKYFKWIGGKMDFCTLFIFNYWLSKIDFYFIFRNDLLNVVYKPKKSL